MTRSPVAVVIALLVVSGVATPAVARPDSDRFGPAAYLALGDSVAAGAGAEPYVTGYPEQLEARLEHGYNTAANKATPNASVNFEVVNYAVGGATTAMLIDKQLEPALKLIKERNGDRDPFNNVEVITVTIGGNDIFDPVVAACILPGTHAACQQTVDAALANVRIGLEGVLDPLTTAVSRRTEIVITTYYNPIPSCQLSALPNAVAIADAVLQGGTVAGLLTVEDGLNDLIRQAAGANRVQVADLYPALTHPSQFVGGRDCLHPSLAGHTTIAKVVYNTLAR